MSHSGRLLYVSPNGDRWSLCRGAAPSDVFVRHEPNNPSGGAPVALIGSLVADPVPASPKRAQPEPGAAAAEPSPGQAD